MPTYIYLTDTIVNTLDGGLTSAFAPDTLPITATAGSGLVNTPNQVTDRARSAG